MRNNLDMKKTSVAVTVGSLIMTGCSSTHTEKWNEIDKEMDLKEARFHQEQSKVAPNERPLSRIIDDFYVDTVPMDIIKEDKNTLPSVFHKKFVYHSDEPVDLAELAGDVYHRTGLSIDFVNNEKKTDDDDIVTSTDNYAANQTPYFDPNQTAVAAEEIIYEDEKEEETENNIYIDKFDGSLRQLLDYVAVKKGLKWKFDQSSNKIFVYKFDTRTFTVLGFGEAIEKTSRITTSMSSSSSSDDQGESSTENEQSIDITAKTAYWESIVESIDELVSEKGSATFNDVQNKIIVTDNDFVLSNIESFVDNLNKDALREIALKIEVVNVTISDDRDINASIDIQGINDKLGISFGDAIDFANLAENTFGYQDSKTTAVLEILDEVGKASVENKIDTVTLNNMPVPVQITQNRSYIENITTEEDSDTGDESVEVDVGVVAEGITMTATPKAVNQNILLDYSLNLSTIDSIEDAPGDVDVQLPITSTKNFVQRVNLKNGVPRVIATVERIISSNSSTHPLSENLWFFGGSEGIADKKDVLMVIVTPYITDLN